MNSSDTTLKSIPGDKISKTILLSGLVFLVIHFFYSWFLFKERMLQEDGSFYLMKMIQHQRLLCEHNRFSVYIFQWIPLLVLKCGGTIEWITRTYSASFELYYLFLFLITLLIFKNKTGALLMILFLCVGMGRDYFVPTNEYLSGILTSLALFGLPFSEQGNKSGKLLTFGCFIIFISINFHPISILSLLFIIVYQVIDEKKEFRKYWIYLGVFVALTWIFRIILFPFDIYESEKTGATSSLMQNLFHPEKLSGLKSMIQYLGRISPEIIALFFISLLLLVRDYLKLLFFITSVYVFLILFSIVKGTGEVAIWHGEYLTLLGAIIIIPFSHSIIKFPKKKNLIPAALSISAFFCFYHIHENYSYFNNRINYVERLIHNGKAFPERRYIIGTKNIPRNYVANTWAITFQTLLLSSFTHADSAMTYISAHDVNSYDSLIKDPNYFLGPEWEIGMFNASANKIRKNYFNLPGKGYKKLATSLNSILDSAFTNSSIHLYATDTILYSTNDTFTVASLKIVNTSGIMIPALPRNESAVHLSYHLYDNSGKLILWDNCRTSLETDVYEEINQGLTVSTAGLSKGKYLVHADLVIENKRWLEINTSIHLLVK